jgi:hypothetical protein
VLADTITGAQLMQRWGTNSHHDLSYWILIYQLSVVDQIQLETGSEEYGVFGVSLEKLLTMIQDSPSALSEKLFWVPEIEQIETEQNTRVFKLDEEVWFETLAVPETFKDVVEHHDKDIEKNDNVFSRLGEALFVKFRKDEWGVYPDQEKYRYIAHLLSLSSYKSVDKSLNFSMHNTDLVSHVKGKDTGDIYRKIDGKEVNEYFTIETERQTDEEQESDSRNEELSVSDLKEKLSKKDLKKLKDTGYKLLDEKEMAEKLGDQELIIQKTENFEKYKSHLSGEYGIKVSSKKGKIYFKIYYRPSKEIEKIRQLIKNQINNAKKDFNERMPEFVRHLDNSLKTKIDRTVYSPESRIRWYVSV